MVLGCLERDGGALLAQDAHSALGLLAGGVGHGALAVHVGDGEDECCVGHDVYSFSLIGRMTALGYRVNAYFAWSAKIIGRWRRVRVRGAVMCLNGGAVALAWLWGGSS